MEIPYINHWDILHRLLFHKANVQRHRHHIVQRSKKKNPGQIFPPFFDINNNEHEYV